MDLFQLLDDRRMCSIIDLLSLSIIETTFLGECVVLSSDLCPLCAFKCLKLFKRTKRLIYLLEFILQHHEAGM